jgi:Protein of unknown function (DUF1091)
MRKRSNCNRESLLPPETVVERCEISEFRRHIFEARTKSLRKNSVIKYFTFVYRVTVCFKVRLYNMVKTYTNHFMPGLADVTQNYCEIANQTTSAAVFFFNAVKRFSPMMHELFEQNIHYCPLQAGLITVNTTYVSDVTDQPLIPPGEYKFVFHFFDENNKTLYHGQLYTVRQDKSRRSYRN